MRWFLACSPQQSSFGTAWSTVASGNTKAPNPPLKASALHRFTDETGSPERCVCTCPQKLWITLVITTLFHPKRPESCTPPAWSKIEQASIKLYFSVIYSSFIETILCYGCKFTNKGQMCISHQNTALMQSKNPHFDGFIDRKLKPWPTVICDKTHKISILNGYTTDFRSWSVFHPPVWKKSIFMTWPRI